MEIKKDNMKMAEKAYANLVEHGKVESAERLLCAINGSGMITLGLNDTDWDIQMALEDVGIEQGTLHHNGAMATFVLH